MTTTAGKAVNNVLPFPSPVPQRIAAARGRGKRPPVATYTVSVENVSKALSVGRIRDHGESVLIGESLFHLARAEAFRTSHLARECEDAMVAEIEMTLACLLRFLASRPWGYSSLTAAARRESAR